MTELITIVVPVHDRADIVTRTLDSIYAQTHRPLSLVIVDNGSAYNSLDVINRWADQYRRPDFSVTVLSEDKPGASAVRNRGLAEVKTEYVMFFDSDDTMEFDHVERVAATLRKRPDLDILHWGVAYRSPDGWTSVKDSSSPADLLTEHLLHGTLTTMRYAVRTSFLRAAGGWNEKLPSWNDYELGTRLLVADPQALHLPGTPRVHALRWDASLTGSDFSSRAKNHTIAFQAIACALGAASPHQLILAARKVIVAALYCREGKPQLANSLISEAMEGKNLKQRMKLRAVYWLQRIAGCGGSFLASILFPPAPANALSDPTGA